GAHRSAGAARWQARSRERVFKGGLGARWPAEKREYVRPCRPRGLSVAEGCRLMGLARSTYYDELNCCPSRSLHWFETPIPPPHQLDAEYQVDTYTGWVQRGLALTLRDAGGVGRGAVRPAPALPCMPISTR